MNKYTKLFAMAALAAFTVACGKDDDDKTAAPVTNNSDVVELRGTITSDMTLKASNKYLLKGFVYVQAPAKLTIEPGTIIKGDKATKATLIIERGAQIIANGTAEKPIVFTSNQPKGSRKAGDWGGLILLGNAPQNLPGTALIEGGVDRAYGGSNPADNSGILKYVRIEFPGIAFQPDNEINGITFGGVGSGTIVDYVQVSYSGDDAFEWFGGTVNARHLIAYKPVDDMFDSDNGFSGNVQFIVGMSDPAVADVSKSNGFESDNDAGGSAATPQTSARFSNVSLFGPRKDANTQFDANFGRGMHIRRNSAISVYNSLIAGWPVGVLLDGSASEANATAGKLAFKNNIISGTTENLKLASGSSFDINAWYTAGNNSAMGSNSEARVENSFNLNAPNFIPATGSPLLSGADFSNISGFENVSFRGAFGNTDWTKGWANFDPQNTDY